MKGTHVYEIDQILKDRFLELIAEGHTRPEAADALDSSARQFRAICNPDSHRYDKTFADAYARLTQKDGEQQAALTERLKSAAIQRALRGSDRLLEKLLVIHDPDWEIHKPQALRVTNVNIEELRMLVPSLPEETLRQIVADYETQKEQKQLRALPDIDAA